MKKVIILVTVLMTVAVAFAGLSEAKMKEIKSSIYEMDPYQKAEIQNILKNGTVKLTGFETIVPYTKTLTELDRLSEIGVKEVIVEKTDSVTAKIRFVLKNGSDLFAMENVDWDMRYYEWDEHFLKYIPTMKTFLEKGLAVDFPQAQPEFTEEATLWLNANEGKFLSVGGKQWGLTWECITLFAIRSDGRMIITEDSIDKYSPNESIQEVLKRLETL